MRTPSRRSGASAPTPPEVRLRIGRLVLDAAVAESCGPDAAGLAAWLESAIGERLGDRIPDPARTDRRAEAVNAVADAIAAHVRPVIGREGGA